MDEQMDHLAFTVSAAVCKGSPQCRKIVKNKICNATLDITDRILKCVGLCEGPAIADTTNFVVYKGLADKFIAASLNSSGCMPTVVNMSQKEKARAIQWLCCQIWSHEQGSQPKQVRDLIRGFQRFVIPEHQGVDYY